MTGPIEQAFTEVFGPNNTSGKSIVRTIDYELAALHQRIDKMEVDNANMDGLRAAAAGKQEHVTSTTSITWAPVTTYNPPADARTEYLLALPSGKFCIGRRHGDGTWTSSFYSNEGEWVAATHFARLEGPKR